MNDLCPHLVVPAQELKKIKKEFRIEVKLDAEKCIEGECPAFNNGECSRVDNDITEIKIGERGYTPNDLTWMV